MSNNRETVRVWDPLVRVIHWTLVVTFTLSYITGGEPLWLHAASGYVILALVLLRLLCGFVGPDHARFRSFVRRPAAAVGHLSAEIRGRAARYIGHNPAGGIMIVALLALLLAQTCTGLVLAAADKGAGPLAGWIAQSESLEELLLPVHAVLANTLLTLIVIHIGGVILSSRRHGENLVRAMFDGRKRGADR